MKKFLALILVLSLLAAFAACGKKSDSGANTTGTTDNPTVNSAQETAADIDINAVMEKIIADLKLEEPNRIDTDGIEALYDISPDDIKEAACAVTFSGTFPDEVIIIKAANSDAKGRIVAALNDRLDDVKVQSENYDPENYALAQQCKVIEKGDCAALFISPQHAQMEKIFEEAAK